MATGFGIDPPLNRTAERYIRGMKKGRARWNKLYGSRALEVMHKTANKMATKEQVKMGPTYNEIISERGDFWHPDPEKDRRLGGPGANQRAREDRAEKPKEDPKKLKPGESYMDYARRQGHKPAPKSKEGLRAKIKRKLGLKNSFEPEGQVFTEDEYRRMLAKERRTERNAETTWRSTSKVGAKKKGPKLSTTKKSNVAGNDYANSQMGSIAAHDKATRGKHTIGNPFPESKTYSDFIAMCESVRMHDE